MIISQGPELAIFMRNNKNLKHTARLLIRHTETMWDRSQTSNLELKCFPPPLDPENHQCNSSKVDASKCFNHFYVNKEKLANNYSEHVVKLREKKMWACISLFPPFPLAYWNRWISIWNLIGQPVQFFHVIYRPCIIGRWHLYGNYVTLCNDAAGHETETVTIDDIGRWSLLLQCLCKKLQSEGQ